MTELFEAESPHDHRFALRADGVLAQANRAALVTAADVHVASRLGVLGGETEQSVLLAVALASAAVRNGSVCLELADLDEWRAAAPDVAWPESAQAWGAALAESRLVAAGVLHWEHDLLHLDRYWRQEGQVADDLLSRSARPVPPPAPGVESAADRLFPGEGYADQRAAALQATATWTAVLTGGPGTGKTTTVAGLLALLLAASPEGTGPLRVALAAPTGKAAARLSAAVQDELAKERFSAAEREALAGVRATTLHRLLGARPDTRSRFRHHRGNRLPHDVIVVDETSMVPLTMMARLFEAVRPDTRLVLVGDHHQLASVEAGAVLADLVAGLPEQQVGVLAHNHRSEADIVELGEAIRSGDAEAVVARLSADSDEVEFVAEPDDALRARLVGAAVELRGAAQRGDADTALAALEKHRLLCAHREGPYGVDWWNRRIEHWLAETIVDGVDHPLRDPWYVGRPVLVTANDPTLGIFNGDTGVVVRTPAGSRRVVLETAAGQLSLPPSRLDAVETMHAMTIHKSQGSQASEITVLLPDEESRLLTRELLYTAVTRARHRVRVVGSEEVVRASVSRRVRRASGLQHRLAGR
ncbi:exodeoxyribonuclease V subunit alpha [Nocardioides alcanivorans]|uniref:exodeoxyribonuclease V subunit alpha n=1 Tax=Nocardioides alcanivorans TaxID=2897352 RepID=UPI001F3E4160|nr:exodeoxyribonuclease V subunit alpha [Nocardioides alcanivorans]